MQAGAELLHMLSSRRVPLKLYEEIYGWHLQHLKATERVTRKELMLFLRDRYNLKKKRPKIHKSIVLPFSGSKVNMVVHDAKEQIQALLMDPQLNEQLLETMLVRKTMMSLMELRRQILDKITMRCWTQYSNPTMTYREWVE